MSSIQKYILQKLSERKMEGNFRSLKVIENKIDLTSNDYLGIARDKEFQALVSKEIKNHHTLSGSTGSRLLSGNSTYAETLEQQIASFHKAGSALIFNSGFDANYGLLSTLPFKGDTIIYDELVHASIHDGIKTGRANSVSFRHNDLHDLHDKLENAKGLKYVVTESVFSMDGDMAPLREIVQLCHAFEAGLIVDEAHATGVIGEKGEGLVNHLGLESDCLARIHTFSKALGSHGAVILCSTALREFLINYCRPFIFSTALPFHSLAAIKCAYDYFPPLDSRRKKLSDLISALQKALANDSNLNMLPSNTPIQSLIIKGNEEARKVAAMLQEAGFDARPILSPTVAKGKERIRIALHSFNTEEQMQQLASVLSNALKAQTPKEYIL
jgi:8-amino-7-oxononanoate synthase